jgi:hypothetical protein
MCNGNLDGVQLPGKEGHYCLGCNPEGYLIWDRDTIVNGEWVRIRQCVPGHSIEIPPIPRKQRLFKFHKREYSPVKATKNCEECGAQFSITDNRKMKTIYCQDCKIARARRAGLLQFYRDKAYSSEDAERLALQRHPVRMLT